MNAKKKPADRQAAQSARFIETARKLGADMTPKGQEKAFGKVGLGKPKKPAQKK